ncbi:MAG: glycosyltransferase family 4 protein [bacterium]|nr:glycosyltransferase family 4 protein [bacterium]
MHILYLHQHFSLPNGTTGVRSYEFSRFLVQKGHKVTVITGLHEWSGIKKTTHRIIEIQIIDGIQVIIVNVPYGQKMNYLRRIFAFLSFLIWATIAAIKVKQVDLIYATSTPITIAVPGMITAFLKRKPFLFEVRDVWPDIPLEMGIITNPIIIYLTKLLEKFTYRFAKHIVALSPGMKSRIVQKGIPDQKVTVIPNASDLLKEWTSPTEAKEFVHRHYPYLVDRPFLVYIGTFGLVNRVDYCVELAKRTLDINPNFAYLLIGDGKEKENVRQAAQEAKVLNKNLFIEDAVPRHTIPYILGASTIIASFVSPIKVLEDNSANKFFDALGAGKPVLINYGGWQADLLLETGAGVVLDPYDLDHAAHQLIEKINNPEWLQNASSKSFELAKTKFHRKLLAEQLETIFLEQVGQKK